MAIYIKAKKDKLLYSFLLLQGTGMLWMLAKILKTVSPSLEPRWAFVVLQYAAICLLEVAFFEFSFIYTYRKRAALFFRVPVYIIASLQFMSVWSNPYHYLFYQRFDFYGDSFGPLFNLYMGIFYTIICIGMVLIGRRLHENYKNTKQLILVSMAILCPIGFNILYITGIARKAIFSMGLKVSFDITPMAFVLALFIFAYATYRYDFLDLLPLYKEEIIGEIQTAVVVTDKNQMILEMNQQAKELFDLEGEFHEVVFDQYLENFIKEKILIELKEENRNQVCYFLEKDYQLHRKVYIDYKGKEKGYIYTSYNIGEYLRLKASIEQKNTAINSSNRALEEKIESFKEISRMSARNYFARELHDILGHSMTLTIKLLEISELTYKEDKLLAVQQLKEARDIANKGYIDLKVSLETNFNVEHNKAELKIEIEKIVKILKVAGIECQVNMPNTQGTIEEEAYQLIKRFCQEGVTNALKHGEPTKIKITLEFEEENTICVLNNGIKPRKLKKGNGIKGLEDRLWALEGRIQFVTVNQWFGICMTYREGEHCILPKNSL